MADNYLENKYEELLKRRESDRNAKVRIWSRRLEAYRKKMAEEASGQAKEENGGKDAGK